MEQLASSGVKDGQAGADLVSKTAVVSRKLTPKGILAARLPRKDQPQKIQWDEGNGLGLRLNHQGKVWIVQARDPTGRSLRRTLGPAAGEGAIGLADARRMARQARTRIERGEDVPTLRKRTDGAMVAVPGAVTFKDAREGFIADISDPGSAAFLRSWQSYKVLLHRSELSAWENRALADIGRADVETVFKAAVDTIKRRADATLAKRAKRGQKTLPGELRHGAGASANRMLSALSSLFEWAAERRSGADSRLKGHNPALGWKSLRRKEAGRERIIDLADLPKIWKAFDAAPAPWSTIYKLCLLTVARRGEIQGGKWDDIRDLDGADARLELGSRTKAGGELDRVVALAPAAAALLRKIKDNGGPYIFGVYAPLPDRSSIDAAVRAAAKLPYAWSPHGFRHVFATWAHDSAGASSDEIRGVLGQIIPGALGRYAKRPPVPKMRALLEKWAKTLRGLGCAL